MKKTLALVLALCMLIACVPAMAETEPTYTYNTYMSEFPTVWSPFQMQTNTDSELADFLGDGFYGFDFNETMDGYVMEPAMAAEFPVDVTADYVGEQWGIAEGETGRAWKITLRDNLAWQDGTPIKAVDFVQSAKYLLNPAAANYRADSYYSGQLVITNAQAYVNSGRTVEKQENNLNITRYTIADLTIGEDGVYTIVQESMDYEGNTWGCLKSGIGWVDLTEIQSGNYASSFLSANYADEDFVLHGAYHHYTSGQEYSIPIAIRAYGRIQNVKLYGIELTDAGLLPGADLITLPEMTDDMPLVAELAFPGDMSMYGIQFVDEDGRTHVYSIHISGRNGALILTEE